MDHRYLRAYMAGIVVPTAFLVVVLVAFCLARFAFHAPVPIEQVIVFPMALIPNVFGVWNMLWARTAGTRWSIGIHGAVLPFLLVPLGFTLGHVLGVVEIAPDAVVAFHTAKVSYVHAGFLLPVIAAVYYLVWKYIVAFLNDVVGLE